MDKQVTKRDRLMVMAKGHEWDSVLMLQARCTKCGHLYSEESVLDGKIPECPGRAALAEYRGHWLTYSDNDHARCKLCLCYFDWFYPAGGDYQPQREDGAIEVRPMPACQNCDHEKALENVPAGDARWGIRASSGERYSMQECTACKAQIFARKLNG
jgi:hypothetical protein